MCQCMGVVLTVQDTVQDTVGAARLRYGSKDTEFGALVFPPDIMRYPLSPGYLSEHFSIVLDFLL